MVRVFASGNVSEFARRVGFRQSTVNNWLSQRSMPRIDAVAQLAARTGVSPAWLLLGIGGPYESPRPQPQTEAEADAAMAAMADRMRAATLHLRRAIEELDPHHPLRLPDVPPRNEESRDDPKADVAEESDAD